jgi:hypothetical protein
MEGAGSAQQDSGVRVEGTSQTFGSQGIAQVELT